MSLEDKYFEGVSAAFTTFKVAFLAGMDSSSYYGERGATRGWPLDSNPVRRRNTIDRAFSTNENLPSSESSTPEAPNRSP